MTQSDCTLHKCYVIALILLSLCFLSADVSIRCLINDTENFEIDQPFVVVLFSFLEIFI